MTNITSMKDLEIALHNQDYSEIALTLGYRNARELFIALSQWMMLEQEDEGSKSLVELMRAFIHSKLSQ